MPDPHCLWLILQSAQESQFCDPGQSRLAIDFWRVNRRRKTINVEVQTARGLCLAFVGCCLSFAIAAAASDDLVGTWTLVRQSGGALAGVNQHMEKELKYTEDDPNVFRTWK
jgi:hypothetical protein